MTINIASLAQMPTLESEFVEFVSEGMPDFMSWESPGNWRWHVAVRRFPELQLLVRSGSRVLASSSLMPMRWNRTVVDLPEGYDDALVSVVDNARNLNADCACLLSISVRAEVRGSEITDLIIRSTLDECQRLGYAVVVGPLRPGLKARYPRVDVETYLSWRGVEGLSFDPWLARHQRAGCEVLAIAPESLRIAQPLTRWESAIGYRLRGAGPHVVPGALTPICVVDGMGVYLEPNVWIRHDLRHIREAVRD